MKLYSFILCLIAPALFAFQTEGVLPWVTNNSQFKGSVVINNANGHDIDVTLVATRADGSQEEALRTVPSLSQLVVSAADLFPTLGEGSGYAVSLNSADDLTAGFVVAGTASASGSSPAQSDMSPMAEGNPILMFNYLPSDNGSSAPVIVNLGDATTQVVLRAYRDGALVATSEPIALEPGRPYADVTTNLFPEAGGNVFVVAEADQPLAGTAFVFNEQREPSMATAVAISQVPDVAPSANTLVLEGLAVTGINELMGSPLLDFGGDVGSDGFPTVGAYNENGPFTRALSKDMMDDPASVIMAAGNGLFPNSTDDFNANVPLHQVPVVVGVEDAVLTRDVLGGMLAGSQLDFTISEPYAPVTLEQWLETTGKLFVRCNEDQSSDVTIVAKDLLPNRIYSLWATFDDNGVLNTVPFGGLPNAVTTDNNGDATIKRTVNFCPMNPREGERALLLIDVVLHSDHMLYGAIPTASLPGKDAHAQLGFFFEGTLLQKK